MKSMAIFLWIFILLLIDYLTSCQQMIGMEYTTEKNIFHDAGQQDMSISDLQDDRNNMCYLYDRYIICECPSSYCTGGEQCYRTNLSDSRICLKRQGVSCKENKECLVGYCVGGHCRKSFPGEPCVIDEDCHNNKCVVGGPTWTQKSCACKSDEDCLLSAVAKICLNGHCISYEECIDKINGICRAKPGGYELQSCDCNYYTCNDSGTVYRTLSPCPRRPPHWSTR